MTALGRPHRPHPRPARSTAPGRCGSCGSSTGLPDDRVALYAKIHMAAIDDVTGAEVMTALLDPDPDRRRPRPAARRRTRTTEPHDSVRLFGGAARPAAPGRRGSPAALAGRAINERRQPAGRHGRHDHRDRSTARPGLDAHRPAAAATGRRRGGRGPRRPGRAPRAVVERADHRPTAASPWPRLPLDRDHRDQAARRHDGQRRRRRRVRRRAARLARAPRRAADVADWWRWCRCSSAATTAHDAHVAGLVVPLPTNVADPAERLRAHQRGADRSPSSGAVAVPASLMQDVSLFAPPARRRAGRAPRRRAAAPLRSPARPSTWRSPTCQARASRCTSPAARWRPTTRCSRSTS